MPGPLGSSTPTTTLLPPRRSMFCLTRLAHRLHALLSSEQRGGLHRSEMSGSPGSHLYGRSGIRVGSFVNGHHIVLAEAVVECEQPPPHTLRQPAKGFPAVLRVVG